ncbi:MAG: hypothetical protein Q9213_007828, partial [Squamulea squamosa]
MPRPSLLGFCALLLVSHSILAQQFAPKGDIENRYGARLERRQSYTCQPARPDVSEEAVFRDACNENPQNNYNVCFNSFIQAYAYCGCYFVEPEQIYNCANVELQINGGAGKQFGPAPSSTILSAALLNGPIAPPSATLSSIPLNVPSDVPVFSPRQTILSSSAVVSSTWACGYSGCVIPPSSLPPVIDTVSDVALSTECPPGACDIPSYISAPTEYTAPDETPEPTGTTTMTSESSNTLSADTASTPTSVPATGVPISDSSSISSSTASTTSGEAVAAAVTTTQSTTTILSTVRVT